ncbi:response regulator [Methylobacterium sp. JK268]
MLVAEVLEDLGCTPVEAADGAAGLAVLRAEGPVDLLITDIGLPGGMSGRQMAEAGRAERPDLKVLFITGYAETTASGSGALPAGMAVLTKPFAVEALRARVHEMIARGDHRAAETASSVAITRQNS